MDYSPADEYTRTAGAIILRISHGYEVQENNDPFVELADKATEQFSVATAPGGYMVDVIPACEWFFSPLTSFIKPIPVRHIPPWFPGAGFRKVAASWSATLVEMVEQPYTFVKQQMVSVIFPSVSLILTN